MRSRHSRRPLWLGGAALIAAVAIVLGIVQPWRSGAPPSRASTTAGVHASGFQRALYSGAILDSSGHLDVDATLNRVVQAHANTYYYLIWDRLPKSSAAPQHPNGNYSLDDWAKLPLFAHLAAKRGIRVIVYLVPPTEAGSQTYRPYGWDYAAWFTAIGRLAAHHRNIVGIAMDDLGTNVATQVNHRIHPSLPEFTVDDLSQLRADARKAAPWLKFLPVLYAKDMLGSSASLAKVRAIADGIIYPFAGLQTLDGGRMNTIDPNGLVASVAAIRSMTSCQGASSCWSVSFGAPGKATASTQVEAWPQGSSIRIEIGSDAKPGASSAYSAQLAVDGSHITAAKSPNGALSFALPSVASGRHTITLSVSTDQPSVNPELAVNSLNLVSGHRSVSLMSGATAPSWVMRGSSSGVKVTRVHRLPLFVMYYCARFAIEGDVRGAADVGYLRQLIPRLKIVQRRGLADGLVAYRLNMGPRRDSPYDGDTLNYGLVQRMYRSMSLTP